MIRTRSIRARSDLLMPAVGMLALCAFIAVVSREPFAARLDLPMFEKERKVQRQLFTPAPPWPADFVAVAIDDAAIRKTGRWPWPRTREAALLDRLAELGVKTIIEDGNVASPTDPEADAALAAALRRTPTILTARVDVLHPRATEAEMEQVRKEVIPLQAGFSVPAQAIYPPSEPFASSVKAFGQAWSRLGVDGKLRTHLPLVGIDFPDGSTGSLPSAALLGVLMQRGFDPATVRISEGKLVLPDGSVRPLLDGGQLMMDRFTAGDDPPTLSASQILDGEPDPSLGEKLAGKLALVYVDSMGVDRVVTQASPDNPGGVVLAQAIRALTGPVGGYREVPRSVSMLAVLLWGLAVIPLLGRIGPSGVFAASTAAILCLCLASFGLLFGRIILPVVVPSVAVVLCARMLAAFSHRMVRARALAAEARADAARAPRGRVALVFTDIQASTRLWERQPAGMRTALAEHDAVIRRISSAFAGYEVKTEGDAFMLAFADPVSAVSFCLEVQSALLDVAWPPALLQEVEAAEEQTAEGTVVYRGLRVRMGVHLGDPEPRVDALTGRMDYFGPTVNRAARVANAAIGGTIVISEPVWRGIEGAVTVPPFLQEDLGVQHLKGFAEPEHLFLLVPSRCAARRVTRRSATAPGSGS